MTSFERTIPFISEIFFINFPQERMKVHPFLFSVVLLKFEPLVSPPAQYGTSVLQLYFSSYVFVLFYSYNAKQWHPSQNSSFANNVKNHVIKTYILFILTKLIAGLTLRQRALFGPIFQLVPLLFFRARVTMRNPILFYLLKQAFVNSVYILVSSTVIMSA